MPDCESETKIPSGLLQPISIYGKPFTKLILDYLGRLPRANKKMYILVSPDNMTRFALRRQQRRQIRKTQLRSLMRDIIPH